MNKRIAKFYLASAAVIGLALNSPSAFACGGWLDVACNVGKTVEKAVQDTGKTVEKATQDTGKTVEKATQDTGKTIEQAVHDVGKAGETIYTFGVREIEAIGKSVDAASKRMGEGKFVDAIWHLSTDQLKHTEENAGKAAQESNILRVTGQIAASVYGGPGAAAAYAAWLAYSETKDFGLALKVGLITGAAAYATAGTTKIIPGTDPGAIAEKTLLAGAIGGAAVAAAGGDKQAMQEGFLRSGGAVLVQSLYEAETHHQLDGRASKGPAYCMAATDPTAPCAPPKEAYELGRDGKPILDRDGQPRVDVRNTDPRAPHVGTWAKPGEAPVIGTQETSAFMITVSKVPGMNAMALLHDDLSYQMAFDPVTKVWTIVPASVVTYYGTGSPAEDRIRETAEDKSKTLKAN
jgi:hypothetical protein